MEKTLVQKAKYIAIDKATSDALATLDMHHPLFLHPSDNSGSTMITTILTRPENYLMWSRPLNLVCWVEIS
jgi:hypothetical protein